MKRLILLLTVVGVLALPAPAAMAAQPFLGKGEARAAAYEGLERTYGWRFNEGTGKEVKPFYRISRSHWQVSWSFENHKNGESLYCWGDVIVWRARNGGLWYHVRSDRADGSDC